MSLKAELEQWARATDAFDAGDYEASLEVFYGIADSAKIHFNIGLILSMLGDFEGAVNSYFQALTLDQYFAIAYFQKGVANMSLGEFQSAMDDFNDAHLYLRGNLFIDYTQIGLDYKLYSCDVLYNRGLCFFELGDKPSGMNDLLAAQQDRKEKRHAIISRAIDNEGKSCPLIAVPKGILYRPAESKVKNSKKVDYLGNSKVVAAMDDKDTYTGFQGAIARKASQDQTSNPIPQASSSGLSSTLSVRHAPGQSNPYKNNQFSRMAHLSGAADGRPSHPSLSRSATTIGAPAGMSGGSHHSMGPAPHGAMRSLTMARRPSNPNGSPPRGNGAPGPGSPQNLTHLPSMRRIMTDVNRNAPEIHSAPFDRSYHQHSADLNNAAMTLHSNWQGMGAPSDTSGGPRVHRMLSHDSAMTPPPGHSSPQHHQPHRSPSLAARGLNRAGSNGGGGGSMRRPNPDNNYMGESATTSPLGVSTGGHYNNGANGPHSPFDDGSLNGGPYELPGRPKLAIPMGKTSVKVHYRDDLLKLLVDAHITYDELVSKLQAKVSAHLRKIRGKASPSAAAATGENESSFDGGSDLYGGQASKYGQSTPPSSVGSIQPSPPGTAGSATAPSLSLQLQQVAQVRIKYRDEDDELVLMTDQEDFEMAKGYMGGDMSCPETNVVERLELWCID